MGHTRRFFYEDYEDCLGQTSVCKRAAPSYSYLWVDGDKLEYKSIIDVGCVNLQGQNPTNYVESWFFYDFPQRIECAGFWTCIAWMNTNC